MGRLIDEKDLIELYDENDRLWWGSALDDIQNLPTVEAIPKTEYENRLKADMMAMLTDIKSDIDEKATELCDDGWWLTYNDIIQQKINSLKENTE